ncbi:MULTISPECIES: hypothetical protein [unclassified Solwaraspora]|uniref:hypothetical protein n=1 Tax=unclassified Solwaraspora TaxID=2627926 RepID=UPI00259B354B|nr:hypothetical protein [Solwaraspora sp. WMMA2056]WJK40492.1 hypothetical protein O7608_29555 [Solwaraspora sp. WMMA2056]
MIKNSRRPDADVAGTVSLWLFGAFTLVALPIGVFNLFTTAPVELPVELTIGYMFATLTAFAAYVHGRLDHLADQQASILNQPAQGVEVFHTSEKFLEKLMEISIGAETVSTLNLSPARGEHSNLDVYFQRLHAYIRARRSPLRSFRSIASIDSNQKLRFLLARSLELTATGRASFAVFRQTTTGPLLHPLSMHITVKDGQSFVFLFPPVNLTGAMDSVLIRNEAVAQVMLGHFDKLWHAALHINEGRRVYAANLDLLADLHPELRDTDEFHRLREMGS